MNAADIAKSTWLDNRWEEESSATAELIGPLSTTTNPVTSSVKLSVKHGITNKGKVKRTLNSEDKRRSRECKIDGCENYIINKGLCFRHGGGKKCSFQDCRSSAKNAGLCWRHGGSVKCIVRDCQRRGKSRGLCWAHGGGTKCSNPDCLKVAVSNGCCWAHGGGKRCAFEGCKKAAYERTHNYCVKHHDQLKNETEIHHM
ncbi:hypothetical protein PHMEG_00019936 [Phytophthora megakarya]|uniref:WRKY19-like zinc finger domain-containing protein n=1 Tax=Phytophthora megakarya TaxID=4795 RepID=A0A225VRL8_9STRA|nr:hypothetical protein PHMEG_00019936 [Phytophthora megakarya]